MQMYTGHLVLKSCDYNIQLVFCTLFDGGLTGRGCEPCAWLVFISAVTLAF